MVCAMALVRANSFAQPAAFDPNVRRPQSSGITGNSIRSHPSSRRPRGKDYLSSFRRLLQAQAFPIYKTYPVYDLSREPKGYFEHLRQQEPEIIFDAQKLDTEFEWRAGKVVFHAPTDFAPAEAIHDAAWFHAVRPLTRDGIVPAISYVIRKKGVIEVGSGACANCHSRVLPDGTCLPGAQGNYPFDRAYAESLRREHAATAPARLATSLITPPDDKARWTEHLYERPVREIIAVSAAIIPGVAMRPGFSYLDPPKIADLIGVRDHRYLDLTVRLEHTSLADIARYGSMCWASNYFFSSSSAIPDAEITAVSDSMRYSDEEAYAFALYVYSLEPPPNPDRPNALTRKGAAVFEREGCPVCHTRHFTQATKFFPQGDFQPPAHHRARYNIFGMPISDSILLQPSRACEGVAITRSHR